MNSRLSGKLLRRVLLAEIISFLMLMAVAFGFLRPILRNQALEKAEQTGARLAEEIDDALSSMANTAAFLANSPELGTAIDAGAGEYENVLDSLCSIAPQPIRSAVLLIDGASYAAGGTMTDTDLAYAHSQWVTTVQSAGQFSTIYSADGSDEPDSLAYAMPGQTQGGTGYTLLIFYDATALLERIDSRLEADYSGYVLASEFGPVFLDAGETGQAEAILDENINADDNYSLYRAGGYYIINRVENGWRLCGYLSRSDFSQSFNTTLLYISLMCLLLCVVSIVILLPMAGGLLRPVFALRDAMDRTSAGDLTVRAAVLSDDELGQLAENFNAMTQSLEESVRQRVEAERKAQDTRYALLVSQVNAHFVYNTMSSINSLARMGDSASVLTMNTALLHILQGTLASQDGELFTTLENELKLLEQYWQIEVIKNGGSIHLETEIPPELTQSSVPRNFLQPLAENSLLHGLMDEETGLASGVVRVTAQRKADALLVTVADNGRGISPDVMEILRSEQADDHLRMRGRHIGLSNLRQRLRFLYGDQAQLLIESRGNGTTVTLVFPAAER